MLLIYSIKAGFLFFFFFLEATFHFLEIFKLTKGSAEEGEQNAL